MKLPLVIRASESDRVFSCHGSLLAVPQVPRKQRSEGDDGAQVHFKIACRAVEELGAIPPDGGLKAPLLPKGYKLPSFSAWIVDWAFERIKELVPSDWTLFVELPIAYRYDLPRPVWVPIDEIDGPIPPGFKVRGNEVLIDHVIISGHMDWFAMSPDGTESIGGDWKCGPVGADPAETNWQAGTYLGLGKKGWPDLLRSKFVLAQPKIDEDATGIPRVSATELDGAGLDRMNAMLAEQANAALEDRYCTDSGVKQCRWCPVALSDRACLCPSLEGEASFMKANLTKERIVALASEPNDGLLGDFVLSGRTLDAPVKAAVELLHTRIDTQGYIDAACGKRITRKIQKGDIDIPDKTMFRQRVEEVLPERARQDRCVSWSKDALITEIAEARKIHKESKTGVSAKAVWDASLAPFTVQGDRRILVIT